MAWIAALISAAAGGGLAAANKSAMDKAGDRAAAAGGLGGALAGTKPYQQIGKQSLFSLAELMGLQGYRTPEELAYTQYMNKKPKFMRGSAGESDFEKYAKIGPAGWMIDKQADMLIGSGSGVLGDGGHFGPLHDVIGAKKSSARKQAALDKAMRERYEEKLGKWKTKGEELKKLSESSLANYDPSAALRRTPGYQTRFDEGLNTAKNSIAGAGMSGNALRALTDYGQTFASNEYGNEFNRRAAAAGIGQSASTNAGNWQIGAGNTNAAIALQGGQNAGNYYGNLNNILQGTIGNYLQYQNRQPSSNSLYGYGNNASTPYGNVWNSNYQPFGTSEGE